MLNQALKAVAERKLSSLKVPATLTHGMPQSCRQRAWLAGTVPSRPRRGQCRRRVRPHDRGGGFGAIAVGREVCRRSVSHGLWPELNAATPLALRKVSRKETVAMP
jgi:hypothetical protein